MVDVDGDAWVAAVVRAREADGCGCGGATAGYFDLCAFHLGKGFSSVFGENVGDALTHVELGAGVRFGSVEGCMDTKM